MPEYFDIFTNPPIPTEIARLEFTMVLTMQDVIGEDGLPTGEREEIEELRAQAVVNDQDGIERWVHVGDHTRLLMVELLTTTQLTQLRDFMQTFKANTAAKILPPPE